MIEPATHSGVIGTVGGDVAAADHGYQISGAVVHVRLGLGLALGGLAADALLLVAVLQGRSAWVGLVLAVVALALSGYAAFLGIFGVIRYGLFTEGCGAQVVAHELRLARVAYRAGVVAQIALLSAIVLTVALIVTTLV